MKKQTPFNWCSVFNTPVGRIGISIKDGLLIKVGFVPSNVSLRSPNDPIGQTVVQAIENYFITPSKKFDLPILLQGTPLQKRIWRAIQKIPLGEVTTYGDLAKKLNTGPRVIGNACRSNHLPIIIPCHRVVAANGLGGYCGTLNNMKIKQWLLQHENKNT